MAVVAQHGEVGLRVLVDRVTIAVYVVDFQPPRPITGPVPATTELTFVVGVLEQPLSFFRPDRVVVMAVRRHWRPPP
jgi:hypothetical protein